MKPLKIKLTHAEFEVYDVPFGWKDEYLDGHAHISPRSHGVLMELPIEPRLLIPVGDILPISEISLDAISGLFYAAFVGLAGAFEQKLTVSPSVFHL